jgi:dolichol-phosphate mannosyltransferase
VSPGDWPSLGVVVPVYNEEAGLEKGIAAIGDAASRYRGRCVVIAVDDGSADRSAEILDGLAGIEVVHHPANAGYGAALRTGADQAASLGLEYVAFIDSDLTNPPEDLLKIGALAAVGHPYIKASRFVPGGSMADVPTSRRWVSRAGNVVGQALFGTPVRDVTNGFRAVRTDLFRSWPLHERDFAVIVEELNCALRAGVVPAEFPSVLTARSGGQRPTAFSYSPRLVLRYLRYPLRAARRRLDPRRP